jgi:hypothetical protein
VEIRGRAGYVTEIARGAAGPDVAVVFGMRAVLVAITLCATPAAADPDFDPGARTWLGADLELLPSGSLHQTASFGQPSDASAQTAYALGGTLEQRIGDLFAIGFAPRLLWNIGPADALTGASGQSAPTGKQLDLRARVAVGTDLSPATRVFAYVAPGYSIGFQPSGADTVHPHGVIAGGGVGVMHALGPTFALVVDIGYQMGFQGYTDPSRGEIDDRTSFFHLAIGLASGYGTTSCRPHPARARRARCRRTRACRGCESRRRPGRRSPSPPRAWRSSRR